MCDTKPVDYRAILEKQALDEKMRAADDPYARAYQGQISTAAQGPRLLNHEVVSHHSPDLLQVQNISAIRLAAENFLNVIDGNCPASADRTDAKRKVREAMMTANASIVLNGAI